MPGEKEYPNITCKCLVHIASRKGGEKLAKLHTLYQNTQPRCSRVLSTWRKEVNCLLPSLMSLTEQRKPRQKQGRMRGSHRAEEPVADQSGLYEAKPVHEPRERIGRASPSSCSQAP